MLSSRSSPWHKQPSCRRPQLCSSSRSFSNTAGCRSNCMTSEVLALAVVAKAAKINSIVDSWRPDKERGEIVTTQSYRQHVKSLSIGILTEKGMAYSTIIPVTTTLMSFPALHVFCEGESKRTPLFGLAAILQRSGFCFHLFKWYVSKTVLTGPRDPPVCFCLRREKHASLTHGSNKFQRARKISCWLSFVS